MTTARKKKKDGRGGARPGAGRPRNPRTVPHVVLSVYLPRALDQRVRARVRQSGLSLSAWIRNALMRAL